MGRPTWRPIGAQKRFTPANQAHVEKTSRFISPASILAESGRARLFGALGEPIIDLSDEALELISSKPAVDGDHRPGDVAGNR